MRVDDKQTIPDYLYPLLREGRRNVVNNIYVGMVLLICVLCLIMLACYIILLESSVLSISGFWYPYRNIFNLVDELGIKSFTNWMKSAQYSQEGLEVHLSLTSVTTFIRNECAFICTE